MLHVCAEFDQVEIFRWAMGYFKSKKIDINAKTVAGETPLMVASREGKTGIVHLIITEYKSMIKIN